MTTPSSASGAGGLWQNQAYPVNNCQPIYTSNQQISPTAGGSQPQVISGVAGTPLGGAGAFAGLTVVPVSAYTGYEMSLALGAAIGPPVAGQICRVDMYWFDSLGDDYPVEHTRWDCPAAGGLIGPASGTLTQGHGPHSGNWLAVTFTDKTQTQGMLGIFSLSGTTRSWTSHDLRSNGGISTLTASIATPFTNELCIVGGANVPANSSISRQIFLYSGQAEFHCANVAAAGTLQVVIQDDDGNEISFQHPAIGGGSDEVIYMPRKVCQLIVSNVGGTAGTANVALVADRI